jgi:P pilus assembly chaperone PapD
MPLASSLLPTFPIPMIAGLAVLVSALVGTPARGAVALSKVIVDLDPEAPPRDDVEITNTGDERQYIVAEPAVIQAPGTAQEKRIDSSDPTVTGLLVSPQKLVLEPHESKLIRVALVAPRGQQERVYRLKVFVGYDVLVIARPVTIAGEITAKRSAGTITFHNGSNSSVELADGRQCDASGNNCATLPGMRLYSGADVSVPIRYSTPVKYSIRQGKVLRTKDY